MVIGNGLLAKAFHEYEGKDDIIIFASGVSNSTEANHSAFLRESKLLENYLHSDNLLVYFSTCSVNDRSLQNTPYILHKKKIESLIASHSRKYIIFRLPILVGKTDNPHTLTNFFYHHIINNNLLSIHARACRYLIDVDDVVILLSGIIDNYKKNKLINVCFNNKIKIYDLVHIFEQVLNRKATIREVDRGDCYTIDNGIFMEYVERYGFKIGEGYNTKLIEKYYGKYRRPKTLNF